MHKTKHKLLKQTLNNFKHLISKFETIKPLYETIKYAFDVYTCLIT